MTSTFEFDLSALDTKMATRPNGQWFLERVLDALEHNERVVINFANRSPTPSFADQCLGGLVSKFGLPEFKRRIQMINVSDHDKPLIKHVVLSRSHARATETAH